MAQGSNLAVLSVIGRDQKGVVARISTHLAGQSINIEDIVQRVVKTTGASSWALYIRNTRLPKPARVCSMCNPVGINSVFI